MLKFCFKLLLATLLGISYLPSFAQTVEHSGWLSYNSSLKFSPKWGIHLDVQLRSADELAYTRNLLIRPGLIYFLNNKQNVTVGYLFAPTFDNPDLPTDKNLTEHRIWEQYILTYKIKNMPVIHRFRLEQRFIERPTENIFSQRIRYFARMIVPIKRDSAMFDKGPFIGLQNEVFLNLQHKSLLNNKVFDQNRAYAALGYRFNKQFDIDAGYMYQYIVGKSLNTNNHIAQLALYARF